MKRITLSYSIVLVLITILVFAFAGCSQGGEGPEGPIDSDSPLQLVWEDAPENTVAILINQPTTEQKIDFAASERLVLEPSEEGFLLIPAAEVEEIVIWQLEYDGADFARTEAVYRNFDPEDDYILDLVVMRPEGGPHYQLSFITEKGETTYYIAYDGRDGSPNIEYIKADQ
jgi:hypothetical protein